MEAAAADSVKPTHRLSPAAQLFALSFTSLFLELMLIRWVPAVVRLVAYYANLMLISSFLGLGLVLIGRATVNGDKMVAPPGTTEALQKYLELAPTGAESENAKGMLQALGAPVATGINKTPPKDNNKAKGKGK